MAPETEMEALVAGVCPQSGHWPYTKKAELYIGFRPGGETLSFSASRVTGTLVRYDIVICAVRGKSAEMEALRYKLYDALHAGGNFVVMMLLYRPMRRGLQLAKKQLHYQV